MVIRIQIDHSGISGVYLFFESQGSLDKYIGDAIVAVFGSLISLYNSARTAVQAAIQMMKTLSTVNERWPAQYGFAIKIGIGINTGEVFLGNIGSPERMEFTVIGDTVNIASRFSGAARHGQILITRETLTCLGTDVHHQELPPVEVMGKTGKLMVFEIIYPCASSLRKMGPAQEVRENGFFPRFRKHR